MTLEIDLAAVPRRHDQTVTEVLDGEAVVFEERGRTLHVLSATATVIWEHLNGERSLEDLSSALSDAFGAPLDVVRVDTVRTVRAFAEQGLLHGTEPARTVDPEPAGTEQPPEPKFLKQPPHG